MKTPLFPCKYHHKGGFSMAMLVYQRVMSKPKSSINMGLFEFCKCLIMQVIRKCKYKAISWRSSSCWEIDDHNSKINIIIVIIIIIIIIIIINLQPHHHHHQPSTYNLPYLWWIQSYSKSTSPPTRHLCIETIMQVKDRAISHLRWKTASFDCKENVSSEFNEDFLLIQVFVFFHVLPVVSKFIHFLCHLN